LTEILAPALFATSDEVVAGLEVVAVVFPTLSEGIEAIVLPTAGVGATKIPVLVTESAGGMLV